MITFYKAKAYKIFLLLLFIIATDCHVLAQNSQGSVKGIVKNAEGQPLQFGNVTVKGTGKGAVTQKNGEFYIQNLKPGKYILIFSFIGLETKELEITIGEGQNTELSDVVLHPDPNNLKEIVIRGKEENYQASSPSPSLRMDAPLIEIPQNIQVIKEEVLEDQQAIDMLETVSRNVSGVQMIEHWGTFARLNIRGFYAPAFRNGMNVQIPWGPLTEDLAIVERIEFVKGPAAFMLSSGEPGGLYNVVTKKPTRLQQNEASVTFGSFNTLRSTLDIGGKVSEDNRLIYRLNLMGLSKGSHRNYEFNNRYTIAPSLRYDINENTSLTAEYIHQYSQLSVVGAAYVFSAKGMGELPREFTIAEPNIDPTNLREHNLFLNLRHQLSKNWSLTAQAGYLNYNQEGTSLWAASVDSAGNIIRTLSSFDAMSELKLGQLFLNGNIITGPVNHSILAGIDLGQKDYFADWWQSGIYQGAKPFNIYNPVYGVPADSFPAIDRTQSIRKRATMGSYPAIIGQRFSALYIQDQLGLLDNRVRLTLGGRYTYFNGWNYGNTTDDKVFSPRVALSISVAPATSVYALYDQSFIPQTGADVNGNAFKPVRANNMEAGIKREWMKGRWNSTLGVFQITKENVLTSDPANPMFSIQLGEVVSKGIEFDLQGEIVKGLQMILNYANTHVEITKDSRPEVVGTRVAGHARHSTNGWFTYRFSNNSLRGFGVSLGYQYQVDRSSWSWSADNESILPDYFRLDGALSYQVQKYSVSLNVNNILNEYLYSGSAYGSYFYWQTEPGINWRLNVSYRF